MTNTQISELIREAQYNKGRLKLTGYRNSDGQQYDYELRVHGSEFYPQLMKDSVEWIKGLLQLEPQKLMEALYGTDPVENQVTVDLVRSVLEGELNNLQNKLASPPEATTTRLSQDSDVVVLTDVEVLSSSKPPPIKSASSRPTTLSAVVAKRVKSQWPLSKYNARFHLKDGKFDDLEVVPDNAGS